MDVAAERLSSGLHVGLRTGLIAVIVSIWGAASAFAQSGADSPRVQQLKAAVEKNPSDIDSAVNLAEELHERGDHRGATTLLWKHVAQLDRVDLLLLVDAHEALKEWGDVIRAANLVVAKKPNDRDALTRMANAQFMRGKTSDAKETLKKVLEADKKHRPAYDILAKIYEKEGNTYELRLLYQDMIETFGVKASFLTRLCTINTTDGENEQGEQVCLQAIKSSDGIADNHVNLGLIAKQKGEPERARKLLKAAADRFDGSEFAQFEAASLLEQEKNYVDAYKYYESCVEAAASSERCLMGLGRAGVQIHKYERALAAFKIACRKNGRKHSAEVRRAFRSVQQRRDRDWIRKFEEVSERCSL